ncbi:uncharacterized protein [Cicer arietinum]|uniref:Uncharacterized protein LOC101506654 n=1 Tax=Cicer arietinum TaxID=3827 RepID=A0A1S2YJ86_CICAR|nr:uncharacterized protein LOC101506654 [Cicer arietinum]
MDTPSIVTLHTPITKHELHLFHSIDRELFCFLIFKLHHEVTQSLLVMTLWLWLEKVGHPNFISRVTVLSSTLINSLVKEALTCFHFLERDDLAIPSGGGLPLTKSLIEKDISLQIFNLKRYTVIAGIKSVLNNLCGRIFNDILQIVLKSKNIIASRGTTTRIHALNMPLILPGFPHPLFGNFDLLPKIENINLIDRSIWVQKSPSDDATNDDKSIFLTFSRGFPVSDIEVMYLFTTTYGDCVQSLTMGGNFDSSEQPLFAIMILKMVEIVDHILSAKRVAKLQINGKHIWARKYEPRP